MDMLDGSRNLTQQLAYELGKAIVQGRYQVDAVFPTEADLSAQFNISRSVTREAVKMLTAKGLISSRPRKGIRVQPSNAWNMFDSDVLNWILNAKPSLSLLREFTQLRIAVEPEAVALACLNATKDQMAAVEAALSRYSRIRDLEDDALDADIQFHTRILVASNNRFFIQFSGFILAALRMGVACSSQLNSALPSSLERYRIIYRCIATRRAQEGRDAMNALLNDTLDCVNQAMHGDKSANNLKGSLVV